MSSREIAELTGKQHKDVMRDIRVMLDQLNMGANLRPSMEGTYLDAYGREKPCYNLPRRECEILVCGYDVVRRAAVIDRWLELETKQRQLPNMTPGPLRFTVDQGMIG
ncbi:Rha family transcriptional regulator [Shewanella algae]|uniref:Rha family transcriptional regulator n=2 Tax=Shewanella TaxID=22 RepID=UPI0031F51B88